MSMTGDDFDLEADLAAALDGTANATPKQQEELEAAPDGETAAEEQARYVREGRRFVKEQPKEEAPAAEAKEGAEQKPPTEAAPPKEKRPTWYKDEYGDWAKLPDNFRTALREQERNAAQAIEKHSTAAKQWEPINEALRPHMQELAAAGSNPQQYVGQLIEADKYLRADPVQALNWLAQNYLGQGWDIRALADWMDQQGVQTQKIDPVKQELNQLRQQVQHLSQLPVQQQRETLNKQIADWSRDKPDFEAVRQKMAALANQNPEASLDDLYEEARWAHPEIRERILAEREDKRLKELQGKRHAGAQSPRGGQPNGSAAPIHKRMSLEDEIAMTLDGGA